MTPVSPGPVTSSLPFPNTVSLVTPAQPVPATPPPTVRVISTSPQTTDLIPFTPATPPHPELVAPQTDDLAGLYSSQVLQTEQELSESRVTLLEANEILRVRIRDHDEVLMEHRRLIEALTTNLNDLRSRAYAGNADIVTNETSTDSEDLSSVTPSTAPAPASVDLCPVTGDPLEPFPDTPRPPPNTEPPRPYPPTNQSNGKSPSYTDALSKPTESIDGNLGKALDDIRYMKDMIKINKERIEVVEEHVDEARATVAPPGEAIGDILATMVTMNQYVDDVDQRVEVNTRNLVALKDRLDTSVAIPTVKCTNRFSALADNATEPISDPQTLPSRDDTQSGKVRTGGKRQKSKGPGKSARKQENANKPVKNTLPRRTSASVVGSSIVKGLGALIQSQNIDVCCYTNPGCSVEHIEPRLKHMTSNDDDIIVMAGGTNNIPKDSICDTIVKMGKMLDGLLKNRPRADIIIPSIPNRYDTDQFEVHNAKIAKVNGFLKHKATKSPRFHYLPIDITISYLEPKDGLHLNPAGKRKYADEVSDKIDAIKSGSS